MSAGFTAEIERRSSSGSDSTISGAIHSGVPATVETPGAAPPAAAFYVRYLRACQPFKSAIHGCKAPCNARVTASRLSGSREAASFDKLDLSSGVGVNLRWVLSVVRVEPKKSATVLPPAAFRNSRTRLCRPQIQDSSKCWNHLWRVRL